MVKKTSKMYSFCVSEICCVMYLWQNNQDMSVL